MSKDFFLFLSDLAVRLNGRMAGKTFTLKFDLRSGGGYRLIVERGQIRVDRDAGAADVTAHLPGVQEAIALLSGQIDARQAVDEGTLVVDGYWGTLVDVLLGGTITDEAQVPSYTLPELLTCDAGTSGAGTPVVDARTWREKRRPELMQLFQEHVYGSSPGKPAGLSFEVFDHDAAALGGTATRKQVTVFFSDAEPGARDGSQMDILIYLPNGGAGPVPFSSGSILAATTRSTSIRPSGSQRAGSLIAATAKPRTTAPPRPRAA